MILLMLACAAPDSESATGGIPPWQGTQIGEEGDGLCTYTGELWEYEDQAPEGLSVTPAELREQLAGSFGGLLSSAYQGSEQLELELILDGPAWWMQEEEECEDHWIAVEGSVRIQSDTLFSTERPVMLGSDWLRISLEEQDWTGSLSPGELPADAESLALFVSAHVGPGQEGELTWILDRPEQQEEQHAASWVLSE